MARPKKQKVLTDKEWLNTEPEESEVEISPYGGKHIPIEKLRPLLDRLNSHTRNYQSSIYKDGNHNLIGYASIELTVYIDGKERTVIGAYNLFIADAPNGFWNGSLKSDCIKNAALELGARFGRNLNLNTPKPEQAKTNTETIQQMAKAKPDSKILKQYLAASERGDQAAMITLSNIYEIPKPENATEE